MKQRFLIIALLLSSFAVFTEEKKKSYMYTFPLYDGSKNCFSMNQFNECYYSASRYFRRFFYESIENNLENDWAKISLQTGGLLLGTFFCIPFTHEEAHRAILTHKGIGSISQPIPVFQSLNIFNGASYVVGVSDSILMDLRDTDYPTFIRMHTAGIESDYILAQKSYRNIALGLDFITSFKPRMAKDTNYIYESYDEYLLRTISVIGYCFPPLINVWLNPREKILQEEDDELKRDIVGHDIYGMVHHLFNPTAEYARYWDLCELNDEEKKFVKRIAFKALLNIPIISPLLWTKDFKIMITDALQISWNTGAALAPFGDFIDEYFYLKYTGFDISPINLQVYFRQYQNKENWFPAFGFKVIAFNPFDWLYINLGCDLWFEPKNLDFNESKYDFGGAFELSANIMLPLYKSEYVNGIGLTLGMLWKSYGFLPEIEEHDSFFKITCGISLQF